MTTNDFRFIGVGLYTVPEASRLSRVSGGRIRRWLRGDSFATKSGPELSPPVLTSTLPQLEDTALTLSFLDLQEIRFVDAFLAAGVKWKTLRQVHEKAQGAFGAYPFSRGGFVTDGRRIFQDLAPAVKRSAAAFVDMVTDQMSFRRVLSPYIATLEFSDSGQAALWRPLGKGKPIVLDPRRSFGQPIVDREGVPTNILAKMYAVESNYTRVAHWYEVSERAVRYAVEYEASLAAA